MYFQVIVDVNEVAAQLNAWEKLGITPFGPPHVNDMGETLLVGYRAQPLKASSRYDRITAEDHADYHPTKGYEVKQGEDPVPPEAA